MYPSTLPGFLAVFKRHPSIVQNIVSLLIRMLLLFLFFLLLIHPDRSIRFASDGLILWYQTVVPTLLPSMLLSSLIVQTNAALGLIHLIHPLLGKLLKTSPMGTYCFLIGLLCGYPMGAKTCADLIRTNKLSLQEGRYLMAFIHFPSPMFITGYICATHLILPSALPILLAIYLPIFPLSLMARWKYPMKKISPESVKRRQKTTLTPTLLDGIIASSSSVMIKIGIYMMLFTIISRFIMTCSLPPQIGHVPSDALISGICGILEMTTGIQLASQTGLPIIIKGCFICFFAAFGGLSVIMQIQSVLTDSNLSLKHYLPWQFLHGILSSFFFFLFYQVLPFIT